MNEYSFAANEVKGRADRDVSAQCREAGPKPRRKLGIAGKKKREGTEKTIQIVLARHMAFLGVLTPLWFYGS